jgi:hypothetical protein
MVFLLMDHLLAEYIKNNPLIFVNLPATANHNAHQLLEYARINRVERVMRPYLEALP